MQPRPVIPTDLAPNLRDAAEYGALLELYRHERVRQITSWSEAGVSLPLKSIGISITENCQLQCRWCHIAEVGFKKTYMDVGDFEALLKTCGDLESIHLTPAGEAFLHPGFLEVLKVCRRLHLKAKTRVITNGIYSMKGDRGDLPKYLDFVAFSVDGATKETFELIRKPAKFDNFLESVRRFTAYKEEHGTDAVYRFVFTAGKLNLPELPQLVRLAAELKHIESIFVAPMRIRMDSMQRYSNELLDAMDDEERTGYLDEAKRLGKELGVGVAIARNCYPGGRAASRVTVEEDVEDDEAHSKGTENLKYVPFCREPWNNGMRVGKRLFPCCYMFANLDEETCQELADSYGFGGEIEDYSRVELDAFYNSEKFWRFRKDILFGNVNKFCGNCTIAKESYKAYAAKNAALLPTIVHEPARAKEAANMLQLKASNLKLQAQVQLQREKMRRLAAKVEALSARVKWAEMVAGSMKGNPAKLRELAGWIKGRVSSHLRPGG